MPNLNDNYPTPEGDTIVVVVRRAPDGGADFSIIPGTESTWSGEEFLRVLGGGIENWLAEDGDES